MKRGGERPSAEATQALVSAIIEELQQSGLIDKVQAADPPGSTSLTRGGALAAIGWLVRPQPARSAASSRLGLI